MNRRMFFASMAGFAAITRFGPAVPDVRSTPASLPAADAPEPRLEWDFTAEDFDAFQARTPTSTARTD